MLKHRYDAETVRRFYAEGYWDRQPLWQIIVSHPAHATAVIDGGQVWTWEQLRALAQSQAVRFAQLGVRRGDVVGVQLPNSIHLVVVVLALVRLGAVYHPLNPGYRRHDLSRIFNRSQPRLYVHPQHFRQVDYSLIAAQLDPPVATLPIDLDASPQADAGALPDAAQLEADDVFLIGATSGSTGAPKLFVHTQNTQKNEARILCREFRIDSGDRFLAAAPLTHRGALMFGLMTALVSGASLVVLREYRADEVLETIDLHRVTAFMAIPAQVADLLALIEQGKGSGASLRVVMISGAPVPVDLVRRLKAALPECVPVTGYGTSETGYSIHTRPADDLAKLQTCGRPMSGMEIRLADDGEILLRGAFVFSGYHADDAATDATVDTEGWFHTGDLGALDEDGYLLVTGRKKNVIIRAGLKIQAEEIEQLVALHPDVHQCALIPVADARLGERACLVVAPREGRSPVLGDVLALLEAQGVAKYKWPERLVTLPALPLNAVGKLDRIALRDSLSNDRT